MASSQDKAIALKDAYVKGIMDGASEALVMPEQDMGEQASVHLNFDTGKERRHNDGSDVLSITQNGQSYAIRPDRGRDGHSKAIEMPVERLFSGFGAKQTVPLSKRNAHAGAQILRDGGFDGQMGRLRRVGEVNAFNQKDPF